jgi:Protein of unknown function (DUF2934)
MPDNSGKTPARNAAADAHPNLEEEIRRLAFEIYVDRGRKDDHDLDDWLLAEAEILGSRMKDAA